MAEKPVCRLIGTDGNAFALIGKVKLTLERAGQRERAAEFLERVEQQESYDALLWLIQQFVEVV